MKKKIRGRIIRILDTKTIVINLGRIHGVDSDSIFSILGGPEVVVDPITKEELGNISVVKGKVKAELVSDKFTVATSKFALVTMKYPFLHTLQGIETITEDRELLVDKADIEPWKAVSETPVRVGDEVEVTVNIVNEETQSVNQPEQGPPDNTGIDENVENNKPA